MKIAVDCRYIGKSGIGRVCEGILDNLNYDENVYYLVGDAKKLNKYEKAVIIDDKTNPFSKKGLFKFNKKRINKECCCIIIPNFIIPFGLKIPVHSIMHDLIFLDVKESVNGKIDYLIKKTLLKRCMKKSKTIACVSEFTKSRCEHHFKKYAHKCYVNYNGLSKDLIRYGEAHNVAEKKNTIIYVGNVKRHKGIKTLLEVFSSIENSDVKLKIIGEKDGFLTGLKLDESAYKNVEFTGRLDNEALYSEIQKAKFLIQPSVYEGFGLPPLEALYLGTQPIVSDIPVFREIYGDLPVVFFSGEEDLRAKIGSAYKTPDCRSEILQKYNYSRFAERLLNGISESSSRIKINEKRKKLILNGRFLSERLTGVQRTAWEILKALSARGDVQIKVAVPKNAVVPEEKLENVQFVKTGAFKKNMWEQFSLPRYAKKEKAPLLSMCNLAPAFYRGYVILHDVRCIDKNDYDGKLFRFKFKTLVGAYIKKSKKIFTVSQFTKNRILAHYPKLKSNPPALIYNGYEHILSAKSEKVEGLPEKFYFSVGSVLAHKNFKYILHTAKNNPDKYFVITGNKNTEHSAFLEENDIKNCLFTGYVSEGNLKWLYENCQGFILPSLYEGFGLPPLEAVAAGCDRIYLSDIEVFKEIYSGVAVFFDPLDYDDTVDLDCANRISLQAREELLAKYSWKHTADSIAEVVFAHADK